MTDAKHFFVRMNEPTDAAGLAAFRVLFGLVMASSVVRYFTNHWIERFYVHPRFHFTYWGFGWIAPLPEPWLTAVFVAIGIAAVCIALGLFYRAATVTFFVLFNYVYLLDVSNYLNHYYLVAILSLLLCILPLHRAYSIDALLRPSIRVRTLPAWMTWLLRAQVGLVYVFAGLAKLTPDWLLHGEPLAIWLPARADTPVLGIFFAQHWVALAMSWAGFVYDTTIVGWLLWRRSRPFAYAVVCTFHAMTMILFDIGIFPLIMTAAAMIFFDPDWPRLLWARVRTVELVRSESDGERSARWRIGRVATVVLGCWLLAHVAMPLRAHLYGGNVLWHEQGMRWSWRVLCRDKTASVTYRVRMDGDPRERIVSPSQYLEFYQEAEFAGQPDLILQLAHRVADDLRRAGHRRVEVRADVLASLNGRPAARLIDPNVDLARIDDGIGNASWILPAPDDAPRNELAAR
jgi:hypothetical protein